MTTLVDCPQSDRAQWSFRLFGTRVRVKFWFWLAMLYMVSNRDLTGALVWVGVCFVAILLHEMGHVFAFRFFRRDAEVVLYGFGGLAIPNSDVVGTSAHVLVALAGPVAGFCLAGLTAAGVALIGGHIFLTWYMYLPHLSAVIGYGWLKGPGSVSLYMLATRLVNDLLFVNFYWGLINLLPVWPLDGGHVSRALLERWDRFDSQRKSLIVSLVTAGAIALSALPSQNFWRAIMFGLLAISSLQALQGETRRAIPVYRRSKD